jgi:hypothetical protein
MSTTPPTKGKKRPAAQTPSGKPAAKASKASTPTRPPGQRPLDPLVLEGIRQSFGSAASASTSSNPQYEELENIPSPDAGTPTASMDTDLPQAPVPFVIPTVDDEIDDDEANSSFQELTSWVRYLAQHRGQRQRLLSLTTEVVESLRDLLGEPEGAKTATYASVAATSAPRPRQPKKASRAQTTRTIQHAITRYERVSKELPGAPKDALLKAIASSNLKTAPAPISVAPTPRKRPACLVKGIRANTVAARLHPGAKVPPSIPAVIVDINKTLKEEKLDGRVREIHLGVRRHVTLIFDKVVEEATSQAALSAVLRKFNTTMDDTHVLERPTFSILKFTAVPTVTNDGRQVTDDIARNLLRSHPDWKSVKLVEPPRFVFPKKNPDPFVATLQVKVVDTLKATVAKKLLTTSVTFAGVTRRCQPWTVAPTARQCSTCLKWGHTAYVCRSRTPYCNQCAGSHLSSLHSQHVSRCKDKNCTHYDRRCVNCDNQHEASSVECPFFKARSSPGQLQKLQVQRVQRLRRNN